MSVNVFKSKLEAIEFLVNLPKTTQVCTDWPCGFILGSIEKVLEGKGIRLLNGDLFLIVKEDK